MSDLDECAKRVGTQVRDKWKLERLLGVGGMAAVYVAVHKIGRRDAIKILHSEVAKSADVRARFEQEAHAVNRFKHPGAVEIRDIDVTEDGAPFLVMELLEGETLSRIARREPGPTIEDVLRWADELLDVLVAAHAQGIVHRDIKPDNLFIEKSGRLKVLDFGIARVRSGAAARMKTQTGATLGTVSYMPPEQALGGDIDARADIFSVGATMFRLISKRKVHEAENDMELLKKMATEQVPPLGSVSPLVPEEVCKVVDRALAFDREGRYPDAASMQADVRAVAAGAPSLPRAVPSAPSPLAMSIDPPAAPIVVAPEVVIPTSEALTVGTPRGPASPTDTDADAPPISREATSTRPLLQHDLPTLPDSTLRSGSPPAPAEHVLPVIPPSPPPPSLSAAPTAVIAIAQTAPRRPSRKLWVIVAIAVTAFFFVATLLVLAWTLLMAKVAAEPVDPDAATNAAAVTTDGAAPDDTAYAPSTSAVPAVSHKPATPKSAAPLPKPPHGHRP